MTMGADRELREIGPIPTSAGAITLRMSVGVNSGTFHMFLVGVPIALFARRAARN